MYVPTGSKPREVVLQAATPRLTMAGTYNDHLKQSEDGHNAESGPIPIGMYE